MSNKDLTNNLLRCKLVSDFRIITPNVLIHSCFPSRIELTNQSIANGIRNGDFIFLHSLERKLFNTLTPTSVLPPLEAAGHIFVGRDSNYSPIY